MNSRCTAASSAAFVLAIAVSGAAVARPQSPAPPATPAAACVAILIPEVHGVPGSATDVGTATRDLIVSFLSGPSIRALPLDARLQSQAIEEARLKECGHVLTVKLTGRRRGNSVLKAVVGQAVAGAAYSIPYGGGIASGVARGVAVATAHAVSSLAAHTRARDELQFEHRLVAVGNAVIVSATSTKAKARVDGEDLLTPLVQRAAETIAATVARPPVR